MWVRKGLCRKTIVIPEGKRFSVVEAPPPALKKIQTKTFSKKPKLKNLTIRMHLLTKVSTFSNWTLFLVDHQEINTKQFWESSLQRHFHRSKIQKSAYKKNDNFQKVLIIFVHKNKEFSTLKSYEAGNWHTNRKDAKFAGENRRTLASMSVEILDEK